MSKTKSILSFVSIALVASFAIFILFGKAQQVNANPSYFYRQQLAAATSTLSYMTPGTATTTLYVDTFLGGKSVVGADSMALLIDFTGSSTASTLLVNQEYAAGAPGIDCTSLPAQCEWYEGTSPLIVGDAGTTTNPIAVDVSLVPQYSWKFASSTIGGQLTPTSTSTAARLIPFNSPTRYTRFVFSMKIVGNGNGGVWAEAVVRKQNP